MNDTLSACRDLLDRVTPLRSDCGRLCGHACCASREGEETGMLLFPGEEAFYAGLAGYTLRETDRGTLLICSGTCNRCERPLSCRIFPLLPVLREDGIHTVMDAAARSVCPLCDMGRSALDPAFTGAVKQAGELLAADETLRPFLARLTAAHDELRQMQKRFGGR